MLTLQDIIHLPHWWEALAITSFYEADFYIPICQSQLRNCLSLHFKKRDCESVEATLRLMAASQAFSKIHSHALPLLAWEIAEQYSLNLQWMSCSGRAAKKTCYGVWALQETYRKSYCSWARVADHLVWGAGSFIRKVVMMLPRGNTGCRSWCTLVYYPTALSSRASLVLLERETSSEIPPSSRRQNSVYTSKGRKSFHQYSESKTSERTFTQHCDFSKRFSLVAGSDHMCKPVLYTGLRWNGWCKGCSSSHWTQSDPALQGLTVTYELQEH